MHKYVLVTGQGAGRVTVHRYDFDTARAQLVPASVWEGATLAEAHAHVRMVYPQGTNLGRMPGDAPNVVEVWM